MTETTTLTRHLSTAGDGATALAETTLPTPGPGQVRIRVAAAPVNPVDPFTRDGAFHAAGRARGPVGLGWDLAGTVEAAGEDTGLAPGDAVIALRDDLDAPVGAHSEALVLEARAVGRAPENLDHVAASTLPLNALTAWQALELLGLPQGARVLITGAAGAVGGFAVEIAAQRGLHVVAQADARDADWLRHIGAHEVLGKGETVAEPVDGALDAANLGAPTLAQVRDGGAFVGVLDPATPPAERGITVQTVHVRAEAGQLDEIARLAAAGRMTPRVAETVPLAEADRAYAAVAQGGRRGRIVLVP